MKTKICGLYEVSSGQLVVDDYVPFTFRAYRGALSGPDYWLMGNFKTSLLEVKIEKCSRAILGVTLPAYQKQIRAGLPDFFNDVQVVSGVPLVGTEGFETGQCREYADFTLAHSGAQFLAVFDDSVCPEQCFRVDRVGFFENSGDLCGIGFYDLSDVEVRTILSWHSHTMKYEDSKASVAQVSGSIPGS